MTSMCTSASRRSPRTRRWELSTRGLKDYLIYFFSNFVLADFKQSFEGVQIESAKFGPMPGVQDGALITFILIPGGTMFAYKVPALGTGAERPSPSAATSSS